MKNQVIQVNTKNKVLAVAGAVLVVGSAFAAGAYFNPREVVKQVPVDKIVEKTVTVVDPLTQVALDKALDEVDYLKANPVVKEVVVDSGKLSEVLQSIHDLDGKLEFVTEDLDESEITKIADRLVQAHEFRELALSAAKDRALHELDKETVGLLNVTLDDDDMRGLTVEYDDIVFETFDFERGDADVLVPVKFRQDNDKFQAVLAIRFTDGKVDDVDVESVDYR